MIMMISIVPVSRDYEIIFFYDVNHHYYLGLPDLFAKKVRFFLLFLHKVY